jgi:hypothetical protein
MRTPHALPERFCDVAMTTTGGATQRSARAVVVRSLWSALLVHFNPPTVKKIGSDPIGNEPLLYMRSRSLDFDDYSVS